MTEVAANVAERRKADLKNTTADLHHSEADEKLIVGYGQLSEFLIEQHYPLSKSTVTKICSPAINTGPPAEGLWGRLPTFKPSRVLDWARKRMRPAGEARSHPATTTGPAFVPQKARAQAPAPNAAAAPPKLRGRPRKRPAGDLATKSAGA
jgi:hypothetical protein